MWENIRNPEWTVDGVAYEDRLTASLWHELFMDGALDENGMPINDDRRQYLRWGDRFSGMNFAVNFYSSGEEVLRNASGTIPSLTSDVIIGRGASTWTFQEMRKGTSGSHTWVLGPRHGGWGVASVVGSSDYWRWETGFGSDPSAVVFTPEEMNEQDTNGDWVITDAQLRETPFFRHFRPDQNTFEQHIYDGTALLAPLGDGTASAMANLPFTQYKLLAEAIPAQSFAVGANEIPQLNILAGQNRNFDMQGMQSGWPEERPNTDWEHSDLKNVAYQYVYQLFDELVAKGDLK